MSESGARKVRSLTRRGYDRTQAQTWSDEIAPESTAPPQPDPATAVALESWGRSLDEARDLLRRQMCPACGEGPWKSPLGHMWSSHGLRAKAVRDLCGITTVEKVTDPELSQRLSERKGMSSEEARRLVELRVAKGSKAQWTSEGRQKVRRNIEQVNAVLDNQQRQVAAALSKEPDAISRQASSLRSAWASMSPEERRARSAHLLRSSAELSAQAREAWAVRGVQPCGTRAAYRRGCRCPECREAYLAYRRAKG